MKKLLSILTFAVVVALGTQSVSAQSLARDTKKPEAVAKMKVAELDKVLKLDGDQQRTIYRALVAKEVNYSRYVINGKGTAEEKKANAAKYDIALKTAMEKALTEEQYKKWLALNMKK